MPNPLLVDVRVGDRRWDVALAPGGPDVFAARVLKAAGKAIGRGGEVALLLTDAAEMRTLNRTWRSKDQPTNVLSFPAPEGFGSLGDVALCFDTVAAEAQAQAKSVQDHAAHLMVHGFLHLMGFDHRTDEEAAVMEREEIAILKGLGVANPYAADQEEGAAQAR